MGGKFRGVLSDSRPVSAEDSPTLGIPIPVIMYGVTPDSLGAIGMLRCAQHDKKAACHLVTG
jgi:hypothetical protein